MFKYTRATINKIINDLKLFSRIFKWSLIWGSFAYYIYAIIYNVGYMVINIILLIMTIGYIIFELYVKNYENDQTQKQSKKIYSITKLLLRGISLAGTLYGMNYITTSSPLKSIFLTLLVILWILQVLIELITFVIQKYQELLFAAINYDIEEGKKDVKTAGGIAVDLLTGLPINTVKTLVNKKKVEKQEDDPLKEKLDQIFQEMQDKKKEKKKQKKLDKKEAKKQKHLKKREKDK